MGPETLFPPCPRKAEVLPARPWVVAPVNPQGLCHLHSTEPPSSPSFLGCRSPETPVRAPGTALKVPLQPGRLHAVGCSRHPSANSDVSPSDCVASPDFFKKRLSQVEMALSPRTSNQDKEIPLLLQTCVTRHCATAN